MQFIYNNQFNNDLYNTIQTDEFPAVTDVSISIQDLRKDSFNSGNYQTSPLRNGLSTIQTKVNKG